MKLLTSIVLFFASAQALAVLPMIGWQCQVVRHQEAKTVAEFIALQQQFPQELGGYNPQTVTFASVDNYNCQYYGSFTCAANDPRLKMQMIGYSVSDANGTEAAVPTMSPKDPCAP